MGAAASVPLLDHNLYAKGRSAVIHELQWGKCDIRKAVGKVADLMQMKGISEDEATSEILEGYSNLSPIRLIDFGKFKKCGEIPRLGFGKSEKYRWGIGGV